MKRRFDKARAYHRRTAIGWRTLARGGREFYTVLRRLPDGTFRYSVTP